VVASLVKDLLTPLIPAIVGQPDFSAIAFTVNGSKFLVGAFINAAPGISARRDRDLLRCRHADEHDRGEAPQGGGSAGSHHQEVPGMPKRGADRGQPLRLLRVTVRSVFRSAPRKFARQPVFMGYRLAVQV
jgi:hypothetical protein